MSRQLSVSLRQAMIVLASLATLMALSLLSASHASAAVTEIEHQTYGIAPANATSVFDPYHPLSYGGGPVVHSSANYVLYWAPQTTPTSEYPEGTYSGEWQRIISGFFRDAALESSSEGASTSNVFSVVTQYREGPTGAAPAYDQSFRGAYTDRSPFPKEHNCALGAICLTTAQIRAQLVEYITANSLPTGLNPATGSTPIYFVLTPPGVDVCAGEAGASSFCSEPKSPTEPSLNQICSYHSFVSPEGKHQTILYAVLPWSAGNYGTAFASPLISGSDCQDSTGVLQEPNQIGLGPDGEYNAGLADVIVNQAADEQVAILTDPLFNGWRDTEGATGNTDEVPDKCRSDFLGGLLPEPPGTSVEKHTEAGKSFNQAISGDHYYLNDEFTQAALYAYYPGVPCINRDNVAPRFTAQAKVGSQQQLTFNTTESDLDLGIAKYNWSFGDGSTAEVNCGARTPTNGYTPEECTSSSEIGNPNPVASVVHQYAYGGTYEVTLTVIDDGGNKASFSETITVNGPPPPSPEPSPNGGSSTTSTQTNSSGASAGSTTTSGAAKPSLPAPVAAQAVSATTVGKATRKGLTVRYQVNEQVTGSFNVLLAASVAKRIDLHMPLAHGLPAGTPPQEIVGKALLITTRGGRGTIKIKFGPITGARLRRLHKVSLLLQLNLRNATGGTTTVLSKIALR